MDWQHPDPCREKGRDHVRYTALSQAWLTAQVVRASTRDGSTTLVRALGDERKATGRESRTASGAWGGLHAEPAPHGSQQAAMCFSTCGGVNASCMHRRFRGIHSVSRGLACSSKLPLAGRRVTLHRPAHILRQHEPTTPHSDCTLCAATDARRVLLPQPQLRPPLVRRPFLRRNITRTTAAPSRFFWANPGPQQPLPQLASNINRRHVSPSGSRCSPYRQLGQLLV
jgi:hypothetical protein